MSLKEHINLMGTQYLQVSDDAWTDKMGGHFQFFFVILTLPHKEE
jgi:hypothetical protein